jgi:hypothetical protein
MSANQQIEDSNDSFAFDNDSSLSMTPSTNTVALTAAGTIDRRFKPKPSTNNSASSLASSMYALNASIGTNKAGDESRLAECLNYLHIMIGRKDKEDIFGLPVTDDIAPGYSSIIKNPMDLSTMKVKIDSYLYKSIMEYRVSNKNNDKDFFFIANLVLFRKT